MFISVLALILAWKTPPSELPKPVIEIAETAEAKYFNRAIQAAAELVSFPTVHREGLENRDNPHFQSMSYFLRSLAKKLDFEFQDHGDVVVISLGTGPDRIGLITHGDVVPADASKWKQSPFNLDRESEPGKLIGRGIEDDKGPIALALFAMKAIADSNLKLTKKIELIVSYTEESSWEPFRAFLEKIPPPPINIALDANYPVTIAEKGWSGIWLAFPDPSEEINGSPAISSFKGGVFLSQVPGEAQATLENIDRKRLKKLKKAARKLSPANFKFDQEKDRIVISAMGKPAHSSTPDQGINAISHLAVLLAQFDWAPTREAAAVSFIDANIGLDYNAEKFGRLAFGHPFMGPATLSLGTVTVDNGNLIVGLNLRSPAGKSKSQLEKDIREVVASWAANHPGSVTISRLSVGEAHLPENPPHVEPLLKVYSFFTGQKDPKPISIGGGTHARLVPNGVNFGPAMPGEEYTGHSEREYLTEQQFRLNLRMYTAMLAVLATSADRVD